jgi:hypothetical protein
MMPVIKRISSAAIAGRVTSVGVTPQQRVVQVPRSALPLLVRAGIVPPLSGQLTVASVDAQCRAANLTTAERFQIKVTLRNCGLLTAGRPIPDR